ncbi:MAG: hypothetical protein ACOX9R_02850 [Armatimonadota bacterium]|jgi:hypothetical protein
MSRLLTVLALLAVAAGVLAQGDHDVTLTLDPETVTIGEVFRATVEFTLPADRRPIVPGQDADFGGAEVRSVEQTATALPDGSMRYAVTYQLVLWEVGESTLPGPKITSLGNDGSTTEIERTEAKITVLSVLPEGATEIRDIRGPRAMPLRWQHYVLAALPVIGLLGMIALAVWWIRSRRSAGASAEAAAPPLSPAEEALRALDELESADLVGEGLIKDHYVRLSWILRSYAERRWALPALEETTGMLRQTMAGSGRVPEGAVEQIIAVLRRADLAKFAKHRPEASVARADITRVREIVRSTRPRQEVAGDAAVEIAVASPAS